MGGPFVCYTLPSPDGSNVITLVGLVYSPSERNKKLYLDNEKYDGYQRDQSVFGDGIDIEDNMSVMVRYRNNVVMNYTLGKDYLLHMSMAASR